VKIFCPKCNAVYSIDGTKIDFNNRKSTKCIKCQSRFYVQNREKPQKENKQPTRITFLHSYFEKRCCVDRRKGVDRRKEAKIEDLSFMIPPKDFIPLFNNKGLSVGYIAPGQREGEDRRNGIERRRSLTN